ncbi:1802_t:CDS:2 [Funneliformis mosseae]|uniref:1802_t:CDS:1 n=1 Tax=Funneliformis mosseae TaxID=27381 RepID=A0A9N9DVB6_FUNMO|nr:1802_t:CDS:2 [Funneliformis mosseae]
MSKELWGCYYSNAPNIVRMLRFCFLLTGLLSTAMRLTYTATTNQSCVHYYQVTLFKILHTNLQLFLKDSYYRNVNKENISKDEKEEALQKLRILNYCKYTENQLFMLDEVIIFTNYLFVLQNKHKVVTLQNASDQILEFQTKITEKLHEEPIIENNKDEITASKNKLKQVKRNRTDDEYNYVIHIKRIRPFIPVELDSEEVDHTENVEDSYDGDDHSALKLLKIHEK